MAEQSYHNEQQLLQEVAGGDESAFRQLFDAYHNKLGDFVKRLTQSKPMAQEIVQDVFLKIWNNRSFLLEVEHFDSYLFVVARNYTFNALKKAAREQVRFKKWAANVDEGSETSEDALVYKEYEKVIKDAIEQLPPQQRKVFQLSRENGMKHEAIARELGLSKETVKKHMSLALQSIRGYMATHIEPDLFMLLLLWGAWPFL